MEKPHSASYRLVLRWERGSVLGGAAQQLGPQGDAAVPRPGQDAHVPRVDRRVDDVLAVSVVVEIPLENLQGSNGEGLVEAPLEYLRGSSGEVLRPLGPR